MLLYLYTAYEIVTDQNRPFPLHILIIAYCAHATLLLIHLNVYPWPRVVDRMMTSLDPV
jgi:hypothetical protein